MCECEHEEYRTTELELRVSQLESDVDRLFKALFALVNDPANPHTSANEAYHALYGS